ncbi:MAG: hypothetical protein KJ847_02380, partial [Firmicutes bacterium]|nr:hypothetical protein [Bacillota bacterium]
IQKIYHQVDGALNNVLGVNWINRTVIANGVIVNAYQNGVEIVINYTEDPVIYQGTTVDAVSYAVIGGQ